MTGTEASIEAGPVLRSAVDDVVLRVVGEWAPDPTVPVRLTDRLLDDLDFSSLRLVELAFIMEELFEMDPAAMGEAPPVGTIDDLCAFLLDKVAAGEAEVPALDVVDSITAGMR
jgi:hypothetical protein